MHASWLIAGLLCGSAIAQQAQISPPISMGIVFDSSDSIGSKIDQSRQAVSQLLKTAGPQDEFFLVQSSNRPLLLRGFTANPDEIRNPLAFVQSEGRSALLDAIYVALFQIKKARNPHKAVVVISDGGNNNSRYREGEIKALAREADVSIFAIGIYESFGSRGRTTEELFGPGLLHGIAEQSGGRHFSVERSRELPDAIAGLNLALRTERQ